MPAGRTSYGGALHGLYLLAERHLERPVAVLQQHASAVYRLVVLLLVSIAWVFFRAGTLSDALQLLGAMAVRWSTWAGDVRAVLERAATDGTLANGVAIGLVGFLASSIAWPRITAMPQEARRPVRWSVYYAMIVMMLMFGQFESRTFIYFQF